MRINILLCDTFPGLLPEGIPSYEWMFEGLLSSVSDECEYTVYNTWQGELPADLSADELYLITGSNNSAYEDIDWVVALREWIRKAAAQQMKIVGICFGHQIIAQALGGKVVRSDKGWGVGIRTSQVVDESARSVLGSTLSLIYNHHDQVVVLPEGATRILTSDFCENDGYRIGKNIITLQGHPEFSIEYERHLILNHADDEPADVKTAALKSMEILKPEGQKVTQWILDVIGG